ncbi:hypothetical protein GCM10011346_05880 [Oceanobacillus neutriphilus]|uniref:Uncharacterized protein n=1 Tax=Oceanobacillus neutriphilus TaxID=531815 RepID=A0ABQ2NNL9_9BACI|nr:hypothetical protein GCM10011346_05880 [Oceanobacillus neutriphilus]
MRINVLINKPERFVTSYDMSKRYNLFRVSRLFLHLWKFSSSLELLSECERVTAISKSPDGVSYGMLTADRIFGYKKKSIT